MVGFFIGLIVGIGLAALFLKKKDPKLLQETIDNLSEHLNELREKAEDEAKPVYENLLSELEALKAKADGEIKKVEDGKCSCKG
jgi:ABC-type Zn uptake system ZnuABC Zn-binding protein ZnuA